MPREITKPISKTITYLDYSSVESWIRKIAPELENRRFWDWICDNKEPHNGGFITLYEDECNPRNYLVENMWVAPIIAKIFEEFPDCIDKMGNITLETSW
jgi:hypothetical protein